MFRKKFQVWEAENSLSRDAWDRDAAQGSHFSSTTKLQWDLGQSTEVLWAAVLRVSDQWDQCITKL